jgi:hypothetical protein
MLTGETGVPLKHLTPLREERDENIYIIFHCIEDLYRYFCLVAFFSIGMNWILTFPMLTSAGRQAITHSPHTHTHSLPFPQHRVARPPAPYSSVWTLSQGGSWPLIGGPASQSLYVAGTWGYREGGACVDGRPIRCCRKWGVQGGSWCQSLWE